MAVSAALTLRLVTRTSMEAREIPSMPYICLLLFQCRGRGPSQAAAYTNALPCRRAGTHAGIQRQPHTLRPLCHQQTQRRRPQRRPGGGTCVFSIRSSAFRPRLLPIVSGADSAALGIKANPIVATAAAPSKLRRSIAVIRFAPAKHLNAGGVPVKSSPFAQASYIKGSYITRPKTLP